MIPLNLPEYSFRIRQGEKGNQIFDRVRKKFVALTPEEWVRQNFIRYIIEEKKYPAALIAVETGLKYNRLKKRSDITVYDKQGKIWMIIECKAPEVKISQDAFQQVAVYNMSGKSKTKFLAVTNGLKHYCCEMNAEQDKYDFLKDFPAYI
ncbi:MAG: type I restriction enzyme HsdR N-terminal domain-containing protein [Bacteroidetes bacterium]|nr:type I restriction enzyme HsdR N-terminal domain-containing protein [Bacteroidota bacterium]